MGLEQGWPLRSARWGVTEHRTPEGLRLAVELYAARGHGDFVTEDTRIDVLLHTADRFSDWLHSCPKQIPDMGGEILTALSQILTKQETIMSQQSDIDAATAALTAITGDVSTNVAQLLTDVAAIQAALAALPQSVDTTALDAAVAAAAGTASSLDTSVSSVTALTTPPVAGN